MDYREQNKWFITSSKFKLYWDSKEAFKKVYIDEVPLDFLKESPSMEKGTMADEYILTRDEFNKHYAFPVWWGKKADLIEECARLWIPVDKSDKVDDLKAKLYGNRKVLTAWECEDMLWMDRELKRQPLFDYDGEYEAQKELIVEYEGMKLKAKIDRIGKGLIRDLKTTKDMKYNSYYEMTEFENMLCNNDMYKYGFQLAWYVFLNFVHTKKWYDGVIDAIKPTGNYAYESYFYPSSVLQRIISTVIIPKLKELKEDMESGQFIDHVDRSTLVDNRYYPILDTAIQKDFQIIATPFYD